MYRSKNLHFPSLLLFIALLLLCISACKKNDEEVIVAKKGQSKLRIIHAAPNLSALDFYLDDNKINSTQLNFGSDSEYIPIYSGSKTQKLERLSNILEVQSDFTFVPSIAYTSFLTENKQGKGEVFTVEDNQGSLDPDLVRIRFINVSSAFTNVLTVNLPGGELIENNLNYKDNSGYFIIPEGTSVRIAILGTAQSKTLAANEFEGGKTYTIWVSGINNASLKVNKLNYN